MENRLLIERLDRSLKSIWEEDPTAYQKQDEIKHQLFDTSFRIGGEVWKQWDEDRGHENVRFFIAWSPNSDLEKMRRDDYSLYRVLILNLLTNGNYELIFKIYDQDYSYNNQDRKVRLTFIPKDATIMDIRRQIIVGIRKAENIFRNYR